MGVGFEGGGVINLGNSVFTSFVFQWLTSIYITSPIIALYRYFL